MLEVKPGMKFKSMTVIEETDKKYYFKCVCNCGKTYILKKYSLIHRIKNYCYNCTEVKCGERFGRLVAIKKSEKCGYWICRCSCGKETETYRSDLKRGRSLSCGCLRKENSIRSRAKHGHCINNHETKTFKCWSSMLYRCRNKNSESYKYYGGRGISVCNRWNAFENFLSDVGEAPIGKSIDRINNNGNYEPNNVRWATTKEQNCNKRKRQKRVIVDYQI